MNALKAIDEQGSKHRKQILSTYFPDQKFTNLEAYNFEESMRNQIKILETTNPAWKTNEAESIEGFDFTTMNASDYIDKVLSSESPLDSMIADLDKKAKIMPKVDYSKGDSVLTKKFTLPPGKKYKSK